MDQAHVIKKNRGNPELAKLNTIKKGLREIFANYLIRNFYLEHLKLNLKKTQLNKVQSCSEDLKRHLPKDDIYQYLANKHTNRC